MDARFLDVLHDAGNEDVASPSHMRVDIDLDRVLRDSGRSGTGSVAEHTGQRLAT